MLKTEEETIGVGQSGSFLNLQVIQVTSKRMANVKIITQIVGYKHPPQFTDLLYG